MLVFLSKTEMENNDIKSSGTNWLTKSWKIGTLEWSICEIWLKVNLWGLWESVGLRLNNLTPPNIRELSFYVPARSLRSSTTSLLNVPYASHKSSDEAAFCFYGAHCLWILTWKALCVFKRKWKIYRFNLGFNFQ